METEKIQNIESSGLGMEFMRNGAAQAAPSGWKASEKGSYIMKGLIEERRAELHQLYPKWEKKTIWKFFEATAERFPDHDFIVMDGGERYTYLQTKGKIMRIAYSMLSIGIQPGDHIAMQIDNSPEQVLVSLAIAAVRAVKVPVNTLLGPRELGYIINQSDASYLVTNSTIQLSGVETKLKHIVVLPGADCEADVPMISWTDFLNLGASTDLPSSEGELYADEICDILYTSGSTSLPKGVPLSHDMLMRTVYASALSRGLELGRRIYVSTPLIHSYGYVKGMLSAILVGGAILLRRGKFLAEPALKFMQMERANDILCVPTQIRQIINYLKKHPMEFSDLHAAYCSASVCPTWIWPEMRKALDISDITTGYGMSETCGGGLQTQPGDSDEILCTRVGKILPAGCAGFPEYNGYLIEYQVINPQTGLLCEKQEPGELWCRGAVVTRGYYNRPEINEKAFTQDGWFKTGDCGYFDDEGYLLLSGRMDDMYKINGENVSPKFLEDTISTCPAVNVIAIAGVPDPRCGYVGAAFVQLLEDTPEQRRQVEQYCKDHLATFQVPKYYVYMTEGEWPRTATGKIQKGRLRERMMSIIKDIHGRPTSLHLL